MLPKKVKNLLPQLSIDHLEDLTLLQRVSTFYWDKLREALTTTDEMKVTVLNLGEFTRKHWKIDDRLRKTEVFYNSPRFQNNEALREVLDQERQLLNRMKDFHQEELNKKERVKESKTKYKQALESEG